MVGLERPLFVRMRRRFSRCTVRVKFILYLEIYVRSFDKRRLLLATTVRPEAVPLAIMRKQLLATNVERPLHAQTGLKKTRKRERE